GNLEKADMREAHLDGANLESADLRGALQLSASQICSAKSRQGASLDETLQTQVDALCGVPHQP
ncbi:MAG: pentapeptide repeat-containing protein, partial [Candidatus Acidiferrales bacterium]